MTDICMYEHVYMLDAYITYTNTYKYNSKSMYDAFSKNIYPI